MNRADIEQEVSSALSEPMMPAPSNWVYVGVGVAVSTVVAAVILGPSVYRRLNPGPGKPELPAVPRWCTLLDHDAASFAASVGPSRSGVLGNLHPQN
jgi:hypothetical protein